MQQLASCTADWLTVLRASESLRFTRVVSWDGAALWFCEFAHPGRLSRDIVMDGDEARTVEDADV
jgi:hypothetical protein